MNNKLNNNFSLRKLLLTALVAGPLATLPAPLWALPDITSANLTTSSGVTTQIVGSTLNVTSPDKAILTWQAFGSGASGIASTDVINYFLPSATSSVLNTVSGAAATTINGSVISNGNVYVLNKSGIIISPTAQINTGGFYASTVDEPSGFFSINGSLSFAGTSTSGILVQGTGATSGTNAATIQAVGPGNNIYLAGNTVNVDGGKFFGNVFVRSSAAGNNATFGATGPVSVNLVGVPLAGGGLDVRTNGGNAVLSGGAGNSLTIAPLVAATTGAVSINTTGTATNGTITQGAGAVIANTTGSVVSLNAGTGTGAAAITLGAADFVTVGATGSNIALTDTAGGITLNGSTATGTLAVTSAGAITQGTGAHSVAGTVTLTQAAGSAVSFTGTGNITFATFVNNPATTTLLTSGDLTLGNLTAGNALSITSSGGQITAGTVTTSSTLTISATAAGLGKLTATNIQSNTGTITVNGDIAIATQLKNNGSATLSVTSSAGSITLGAATASSTLTLTSTAGSITTGAVQTATLNMTAANGTITTGALSTGNSVSISGGTVSTGNISSTNTGFTITASTGNLTTGTISTNSNSTLTASAGSITLGTVTSSSTFTVTAALGSITTGTISSSNTITLSAPSATGTITAGTINQTSTRNTTLTSGGSITLPGITGTNMNLFVNSTAGSISQTAATAITQTSGVVTLNAAGDINLPTVTNDFATLVLQGGASATTAGVSVVDANSIILGTATNTLAPTTITTTANGSVTLGNAAIDTLNFGSTLTLRATGTGTIGTNANTVTVFGNVSLNTAGTNATLGQNIFGNAANYKFGQIQAAVGGGALSVFENTTLNLGAITAGSIDARSLSSDIVNTGALTVAGNAIFAANSIFSPGSVSLTNTSNALTGGIFIGNAANFTLVNAASTTVTAGTPLVNGKAGAGVTNVTVTGAGNTLTLKTDILGVQTGGDFATVSFSAPGNVVITDPNTVTLQNISNTGTGTVDVTTGGPIVLGSGIVLGSSGTTTLISQGATASISDSAPAISIKGNVQLQSDNSIAITNASHSFGPVSLTTTGANGVNGTANITYTEGGTANLNLVRVNSLGNALVPAGSLTVVSTGGDIIQTPVTGRIDVPTTGTGTGTVSFSSSKGAVSLTNPAVANAIAPVISLSAVGNSSVAQAANIALGNVAVTTGTLSVDSSVAPAATITQAAGSSIKANGNSTFQTRAGAITLTNSGNNFGGLTLTSNVGAGAAAGADVAITEAGVLNLVSVNTGTTGKLSATSEKAAIIQSGTAGIVVGGATTLTAADAGITLNTATTNNNFGGSAILVTTLGNVSIQDSNAITVLNGNSNIGGSLVLKNNTAALTGQIKDSPGTLTVTGNVLFDTGTNALASVSIGSSTSKLGPVQFRSGAVTIVENDALNLLAGSVASGAVSLTSSGNIVTSGSGGGTFQNKLDLNASGSITITNPIFVNGAVGGPGLTFRALGAVDLSALSLAGNLNSIAPTNLGASSYKAPTP